MVFLGRADEVIERLRSGVQRLQAHGEVRTADSARLQLGLALMTTGREAAARDVWLDQGPGPSRSVLPAGFDAVACLGVLALLRGNHSRVRALHRQADLTAPASQTAWGLILPLVELATASTSVRLPEAALVRRAVALGMPGMFLASLLISEAQSAGKSPDGNSLSEAYRAECARLGVDPDESQPWLERARRARRS
jgi:hypothetical protein